MSNFKPALITGAAALIVVAITIIILSVGGGSSKGLYISSCSGDVLLSNSTDGTSAAAETDTVLKGGDVITVNADSFCTLVYRSKKNDQDQNYIVVEPMSQVFITEEFDGSKDGELYLNRGAVIVCSLEDIQPNVIVRTANSSYTTENTVTRVEYTLGSEASAAYTDCAAFGGNVEITMFNSLGNIVTVSGSQLDENTSQLLGSGRVSRVNTGTDSPYFEYLNTEIVLSDYSSYTLKTLITASSFGELAFTAADLKTAYDSALDAESSGASEDETNPDNADTSDTIQTAASMETTTVAPETTASTESTTAAPHTTRATEAYTTYATTTAAPASTTAPPQTTAQQVQSSDTEELYFIVTIIIDDEIYEQEVAYGNNAEKPADPVISGKIFTGWDGSFENITSDVTITAQFADDSTAVTTASTTDITFVTLPSTSVSADLTTEFGSLYHTVTIVIGDSVSTVLVKDGDTAPLPDVNVPGYTFLGWDKSALNITADTTITAMLTADVFSPTTTTSLYSTTDTVVVTFVVDGASYPVVVQKGQTAVPPLIPTTDRYGNNFVGWLGNYSSVTEDTTVTALFAQ